MSFVDRDPSDSAISVDVARPTAAADTVRRRKKAASGASRLFGWAMGIGVALGLTVLVMIANVFARRNAVPAASPNAVTDNVVHLHAKDLAKTCWNGLDKSATARLKVAMEVGIDGKIRYAQASGGGTPELRSCVEAHVKSWEFLTQLSAQTMALPFEVDRR
jgi:hypothetical protein